MGEIKIKSFLILGISFAVVSVIFFLFKYWPQDLKFPLPKVIKIAIVSTLVFASALINVKSYLGWALFPRFDIKNISKDFGRAFDHMSISGLLAPVISLENKHEAHPYYSNYINKGKDFIPKYKITHIFTATYAIEKKNYEQDFPEIMRTAKLLSRYPLWRTYVELYEINPPPQPQKKCCNLYEGETFFGERGIPRFDKNASGNFSFLAEKNKKGILLELPDLKYYRGKYNVTFRIKGENKFSGSDRIARVDVVEMKRKKVFAFKNLYSKDFSLPGTYQNFNLSFKLKKATKITLRIYSTGKVDLWIDKVIVNRL